MATNNLNYNLRFGAEVQKAANTLASSAPAADITAASARYSRWFRGDVAPSEPMATAEKKFRKIDPSMAIEQIASITKDNLTLLGHEAAGLFDEKLPAGHRMRKAVRSSVLPHFPYLGVCKFGEVVSAGRGDRRSVTQFFIANFDGVLNPDDPANFCVPTSRAFDQMFYALNVVIDGYGNVLGIDKERGQSGVSFRTKDMKKALFGIASISTGLSVEALSKMISAKK